MARLRLPPPSRAPLAPLAPPRHPRRGAARLVARLAVAVACAAAAAVALGGCTLAAEAVPLGRYWVNGSAVDVSGLSAGAYMAVQFHVAFAGAVRGAAALAGGPYYCARNSVSLALTACMTSPAAVDVDALIAATDQFAQDGAIDPTRAIQGDPVFVLAGTRDTTVDPQLSRLLETYYRHYGADVRTEYTLAAGHAHITDGYGNPCATASQSPYLSDCAYDAAGVLLAHLAGQPLRPRQAMVQDNLVTFEQDEFGGRSMDPRGFVYVPTACQGALAPCAVHIAFHGCLQAVGNVGDEYAAHAGYNEWAEANNIIVLYPQAEPDLLLGNPNSCFDWWGYADRNYAVQTGSQMAAVWAMLQRLASGTPALAAPTDLRLLNATDSSLEVAWSSVADAATYTVLVDGAVAAAGLALTTHTVGGLPSGSVFAVAVQAVSATGAVSPPSSPLTASTTGPPPPLGSPQAVRVVATTASSVSLAWNPVAGAASYLASRDGGVALLNTTSPAVTDAGLLPETTYAYLVYAVDSTGQRGPASATVLATTAGTFVCQTYEDNNYAHVASGRAYVALGYAYALGSGDLMGLYNTFYRSTLSETAVSYFIVGLCPAHHP